MASDDRFENRCEFLSQLTTVVKSSPGTSFIHKEQGRKYRLKLAQEQALASSTALLSQCKLGSLPKFPSKVIFLLKIRERVAWFHLNFIHAISPGDVWMFGGEGKRKEENFPSYPHQVQGSFYLVRSGVTWTGFLCSPFFFPFQFWVSRILCSSQNGFCSSEGPWSCIHCMLLQWLKPWPDFMFKITLVNFLNTHIVTV